MNNTNHFYRRFFLIACLCCSGILMLLMLIMLTSTASAQVLTEKVTDLGFGFKQIQHTQVNVRGRWKSDVKFHFLYFEKRRLCQCTSYAISDSGRYAIFQEMATKESFIFHVNTQEREQISKAPVSPLLLLKEVTWNKNETRAQLEFEEKNTREISKLTVKIKKKRISKKEK